MEEKVIFTQDVPIGIFDAVGICHERPLHFHDCLEMNLVTGGHGINFVENKKYEMSEQELYLLNNYEHHISMSDGTLKMKVLLFYPDFVWQNVPANYDYLVPFYGENENFENKVTLTREAYIFILNGFKVIEEEFQTMKTGWELFARAKLLEILAFIYRYLDSEKSLTSAVNMQMAYERIRKSIDYIHENYHKELSLEYLAALSCMSRTYFSSYFKNTMHMTVTEYVELIRINHARCEIAATGAPITEICFNCGYHNISSFNVAFKKVCGVTPSTYRKQYHKKP